MYVRNAVIMLCNVMYACNVMTFILPFCRTYHPHQKVLHIYFVGHLPSPPKVWQYIFCWTFTLPSKSVTYIFCWTFTLPSKSVTCIFCWTFTLPLVLLDILKVWRTDGRTDNVKNKGFPEGRGNQQQQQQQLVFKVAPKTSYRLTFTLSCSVKRFGRRVKEQNMNYLNYFVIQY